VSTPPGARGGVAE